MRTMDSLAEKLICEEADFYLQEPGTRDGFVGGSCRRTEAQDDRAKRDEHGTGLGCLAAETGYDIMKMRHDRQR